MDPHPVHESTIGTLAGRAKGLLRCCENVPDEETRSFADCQLTRFNLWASNIGVFASRHASLDYRLRTAPLVSAAVTSNIEVLCGHVISVITGDSDTADDILDAFDIKGRESRIFEELSRLAKQSASNITSSRPWVTAIERSITTLHRLSLAIRKSSNRSSLMTVPSLFDSDPGCTVLRQLPPDPDNLTQVKTVRFDTSTDFQNYIRRVLSYRWLLRDQDRVLDEKEGLYREIMLGRCVDLICTRRKQLSYFREHQRKLDAYRVVVPRQMTRIEEASVTMSPEGPKQRPTQNFVPDHPSQDPIPETILSETNPSEFESGRFQLPASTRSASSGAPSSEGGGLREGGPFGVPPAPTLKFGETERLCPYCQLVLPAKTFTVERKWRRHLMEDLQPYYCIFDNCKQLGKTYHQYKSWQTHLSQPHERSISSPGDASGDEPVWEESCVGAESVRVRTENKAQMHAADEEAPARRVEYLDDLSQRCFVCLEMQKSSVTLLPHLGTHFKAAFLLALPGSDDMDPSRVVTSAASSSRSGRSEVERSDIDDLDVGGLYKSPDAEHQEFGKSLGMTRALAPALEALGDDRVAKSHDMDAWVVNTNESEIYEARTPRHLINTETLQLEHFAASCPKYAILSHTWGDEEVSFTDLSSGPGTARHSKVGFAKIVNGCKHAQESNLEYMWFDTCCIDRQNVAELTEAINSMYDYYRLAKVCYVYLPDVPNSTDFRMNAFANARWFTRGWTLLELLAPRALQFFADDWTYIGDEKLLAEQISSITGIPESVVLRERPVHSCTIRERMSWASQRVTAREEDLVYCLMGIFDVRMLPVHGEGLYDAFQRLQVEIFRSNVDNGDLPWRMEDGKRVFVAQSPADPCFRLEAGEIANDDASSDSDSESLTVSTVTPKPNFMSRVKTLFRPRRPSNEGDTDNRRLPSRLDKRPMTTNARPHLWTPLNASRKEIRLFTISNPSTSSTAIDLLAPPPPRFPVVESSRSTNLPLELDLRIESLLDRPHFRCLSFTFVWNTDREDVLINGFLYSVPRTLVHLFRQHGGSWGRRALWADCMCINQSDLTEQGLQRALLPTIVSSAVDVICWIGEDTRQGPARRGFSLASWATEVEGARSVNPVLLLKLLEYASDVLERPYFKRLWILAGILPARMGRVCYGRDEIDLEKFVRAASALYVHVLAFQLQGVDDWHSRRYIIAYQRSSLPIMYARFTDPDNMSQTTFMSMSRSLQCSYSLDKVHVAFTALRKDDILDYDTQDLRGVYREFAGHVMHETQSLQLLREAVRLDDPIDKEWPSWVPDWRQPAADDRGNLPFDHMAHFTASLGHPAIHADHNMYSCEFSALEIDTVDHLEHSWQRYREEGALRTTEGQLDLEKVMHGFHQWRTYLDLPPLDVWPVLLEELVFSRDCNAYERLKPADLVKLDGLRQPITSGRPVTDSSLLMMMYKISLALANRTPCRTLRGYVGQVPRTAREGDGIFVLAGSTWPWVLRPATSKGPNCYRLVGECYIRGIMDGEAVTKAADERGGKPEEVFKTIMMY